MTSMRIRCFAVACTVLVTIISFIASARAFGPTLPEPRLVPHAEQQPKPWPGLFPKATSPPARHIYLIRADRIPPEDFFEWYGTVAGLAGLVNRSQPQVYVQAMPADPQPKLFLDRGLATKVTELSQTEFINRFASYATGAVVWDKGKYASRAAACVVRACEGWAMVSPDHIGDVPWDVKMDLRGRFSTNAEAYWWAYDKYWDQCTHWALAFIKLDRNVPCIDVCTAFKVFPFWVMPKQNDELEFDEGLAAKFPCSDENPKWTVARLPDGTLWTP